MFFRSKTSERRKSFLIDSNQQIRRKPKILRNRLLNLLLRLVLLKPLLRFFRFSVLGGLLLLGMLCFVVFAIFSPYFDLKKVSVLRDNPHIDVEAIQEHLKPFYGKNLLFLVESDLVSHLKEKFPEFRSVEVTEDWPDSLSLQIKVSPPLFTLLDKDTANFSVISEDGVILDQSSRSDLPVLEVYGFGKPIVSGMVFTSRETLQEILKIKALTEQKLKIPVKELQFFPIARELHLVLQNQTEIWMDIQYPLEPQLQKLEWAAERIGLYKNNLEHVDLRIPDRLFWK